MEITRRSKLLEVLQAYPFLEEQIIAIAPPFKNLRNPVLRRSVGRLATIEQVAHIGEVDVVDLINRLRRAAGQGDLASGGQPRAISPAASAGDPDWIAGEPTVVVDGTELLNAGEVPLQHVTELLAQLQTGDVVLLLTDFEPSPIVDAMHKQHHEVHHKTHPADPRQHLTYIRA